MNEQQETKSPNPEQCEACGKMDALVTGYDPTQATCRFCGSLNYAQSHEVN